jgi:hypothetical protein
LLDGATLVTKRLIGVAPLRVETFRSYSEFEAYLAASDKNRRLRWLHERSLASTEKAVTLNGTCGLCLAPTAFTSSTHGGELVPHGRVPNWREGLACGCEYRLINRQRALLHLVAAENRLQSWTRILAMGEVLALKPFLSAVSDHVTLWPGSLDAGFAQLEPPRGGFHLILSVEQLSGGLARLKVLSGLHTLLAPGGLIALTAPFDVNAQRAASVGEGIIGWDMVEVLMESGFSNVSVRSYWSEEFGYLGAFNMMVTASRW